MNEHEIANETDLPTLQQAINHTKALAERKWRDLPKERMAEDTLYSGAIQKDPYALLAVAIFQRRDLGNSADTLKELVENGEEELKEPLLAIQRVHDLWQGYVEVLGRNLKDIGTTPGNENS